MKWIWNGEALDEIPEEAFGFVYKITCLIEPYKGWIYIGKKNFYSVTNKRLSKKRSNLLYKGIGRKPKREQIRIESDWRTYNSSSKLLKSLIEIHGEKNFKFEVLMFGKNSTDICYEEVFYQIKENVFFVPSFNDWIQVKINKKNMPK